MVDGEISAPPPCMSLMLGGGGEGAPLDFENNTAKERHHSYNATP